MIANYYPSSKKTHNLKDMVIKFFEKSKYFSNFKIFKMKCRIWQNLHILRNSYLFKNDEHKTCDLLGQLYVFLITSCKRFHSKILSYEK